MIISHYTEICFAKQKSQNQTHTHVQKPQTDNESQPEVSCITACQSCLTLQPGLSKFRNFKLSV